MKTKTALPYYGSDSEVAARIAELLDGCSHVTIPFVGGAGIIQHLTAKAILANDKYELAINFYQTLSGALGEERKQKLIEMCEHTLSHPGTLYSALAAQSSESAVERAWGLWAACWVGRKGRGGTKDKSPSVSFRRTADGGNNASRLRAAASDLEAWARHFRRCEWVCMDFRKLLSTASDSDKCGIYVDAPWIGAGGKYIHGFDEQDHRDLASQLGRFARTRIVVRYGPHELLDEIYAQWSSINRESRTQSNSSTAERWYTRNMPV